MSAIANALSALRAAALALLARLANHTAASSPTQTPAERRAHRAATWLAALAALLNGDRLYHRPARFIPPDGVPPELFAAPARPARRRPAPTEASRAQARAASRLATIRRVFATVPTATLATRLARRLGLTPQSEAWPHALAEIQDPPAALALRLFPHATPHPSAKTIATYVLRAARRIDAIVAQIAAEEPLLHSSA